MTTMIRISVDSFRRINTFSKKITSASVIGPCTRQIYRFLILSLKKSISGVLQGNRLSPDPYLIPDQNRVVCRVDTRNLIVRKVGSGGT
jgi:hypothetical protein